MFYLALAAYLVGASVGMVVGALMGYKANPKHVVHRDKEEGME